MLGCCRFRSRSVQGICRGLYLARHSLLRPCAATHRHRPCRVPCWKLPSPLQNRRPGSGMARVRRWRKSREEDGRVRGKRTLGELLWSQKILNSRAMGIQKIQSDPGREGDGPGAGPALDYSCPVPDAPQKHQTPTQLSQTHQPAPCSRSYPWRAGFLVRPLNPATSHFLVLDL